MTRKLILFAMITPFMVYALHSQLSGAPGGDKNKKKGRSSQTDSKQAEAMAAEDGNDILNVAESGGDNKKDEKSPKPGPAKKMVTPEDGRSDAIAGAHKELRFAILRAELKEELENYKHISMYGNHDMYLESRYDGKIEKVAEEVANAITNQLMEPVKESEIFNPLSAFSFGRCPSGLRYRLAKASADKPITEGELFNLRGCDTKLVAKFRVVKERMKVQMFVSKQTGYIDVDEWIEVRGGMEMETEGKSYSSWDKRRLKKAKHDIDSETIVELVTPEPVEEVSDEEMKKIQETPLEKLEKAEDEF